MAKIVGYIAASLDGFIAGEGDDLAWLSVYDGMDLGEHDYARFLGRIGTIVMGRATYDFVAELDQPWPYSGQRVFVVTSRPIEEPKGELQTRRHIDGLIAELRDLEDGDVWMVGGGRLQMAFLERGALDEIEIYLMPELIGGGAPLFPPTGFRAGARLLGAEPMDRGCVRLHYAFDRPVAA
ncbi:dihydrofolate reductase family protein [Roseibium sp. Sym1]|uniref:dihydrofolate reductase family protein n=1 Tax=Roseibium sp. Sym1 TaxID=3016006 RepID=UPI0022B43694|nr:dihydrofolate reductase family protein [Roseibium sp. Sym1]